MLIAQPKRARGSNPKAKDDEDELVRRLTARLNRVELEALVVANVRSGGAGAITRAELEARLPKRLQSFVAQRLEVTAGESRTGTGLFDALDDALLQTILARLEPLRRVRITGVCKSWLKLRRDPRRCAELFADLVDWDLTVSRLKGFVGWLPGHGKEVLRSLAVATSGNSKPASGADKLPALLSSLPSLTALALSGNKTPVNAIGAAAKAFGAQLKRLELRDVDMPDAGAHTVQRAHQALIDAAKQLPRLETLALPSEILLPGGRGSDGEPPAFNGIFSALSQARGGGLPVLRALLVSTCHGRHTYESPWEWVTRVGGELPELEVLHAHELQFRAPAAGAVHAAWAPLPRLRELELVLKSRGGFDRRASDERTLLSSERLGAAFGQVFNAAPELERLLFDANVQTGVDSLDLNAQPALAGALSAAPKSLRELALYHIDVEVADLEALDLPNLRVLTLCNCGPRPDADAAKTRFAQYERDARGRFKCVVSFLKSYEVHGHHVARGEQRRGAGGSAGGAGEV